MWNEFHNTYTVVDYIEVLFATIENQHLTQNFRRHFITDKNLILRY